MRRTTLSLLLTFAAACADGSGAPGANALEAAERGEWPEELSGSYYCGDGLGFNLQLDLSLDGTYSCSWSGCLGEYGSASGTWRGSKEGLIFTAEEENGTLRNYLKSASVLSRPEGGWSLQTNQLHLMSAIDEAR